AAGYEADPEKRDDLRQEIHIQIWRSLQQFDGRCSLKTWALRVAHNTAVSYVGREQRRNSRLVTLEEADGTLGEDLPDIDRDRALQHLSRLIHELKPLDRQIMLSYLEDLDATTIGEITGLSPAYVATKIHRIKNILARRFRGEQHHA
ncbi:MAG TPA: sigma-70 family RNA polymerase sigma factor, partial [Bryobacteraceae bacterium]|nr:sigma-70 family RNA polymerase sigma factor [Bryobacteraceae bacterium]